MLDTLADIKRKINKAYCPPNEVIENPILDYCKYIIFELVDTFRVERPAQYGGNVEYKSYSELETDYKAGTLTPPDLKPAVIKYLNQFIEPIRVHFQQEPKAKELAEFVQREYKRYMAKK
jgi:tyrosyl-tRNA synthetase